MLETAEEFHEVNDLIMRHTTLTATNQDLKDQQEQTALLAEQTRYSRPSSLALQYVPCLVQLAQPSLQPSSGCLTSKPWFSQAIAVASTVPCRAELQAYTKAKTDEILNLNNSISRLKTELEDCEAESYAQESKKDYSLQVASQKTLEYGQVGLLSQCCVDGVPGWGLAPLA